MTIHSWILAIMLSWAGLDIAFLWAMIRHARLRDEATTRRRLGEVEEERRQALRHRGLRVVR